MNNPDDDGLKIDFGMVVLFFFLVKSKPYRKVRDCCFLTSQKMIFFKSYKLMFSEQLFTIPFQLFLYFSKDLLLNHDFCM